MADVGIPTADDQHAERVTFLLIEPEGDVVIASGDFDRLAEWIEKRSFGRVRANEWHRHSGSMWCPVAKWYSRVWHSHPRSQNMIVEVGCL